MPRLGASGFRGLIIRGLNRGVHCGSTCLTSCNSKMIRKRIMMPGMWVTPPSFALEPRAFLSLESPSVRADAQHKLWWVSSKRPGNWHFLPCNAGCDACRPEEKCAHRMTPAAPPSARGLSPLSAWSRCYRTSKFRVLIKTTVGHER